jgi:serine/threonine protein phosphatase 1
MSERDRFVVLRSNAPIWVVPAIHGEARRLAVLYHAIADRLGPRDQVVHCGNYLGVGADPRGVFDELLRFRLWLLARPGAHACDVVHLRGAQEEMWGKLLQVQFAPNPAEVLAWMAERGVLATLVAYGGDLQEGLAAARAGPVALGRWTQTLRRAVDACPGHTALRTALKRACYTDDRRLLFVHTGYDPTRPLDRQGDAFWWAARAFERIDAAIDPFRMIVRGCDPARRGVVGRDATLSIDGGCGHGGALIAVRLAGDGSILDEIAV